LQVGDYVCVDSVYGYEDRARANRYDQRYFYNARDMPADMMYDETMKKYKVRKMVDVQVDAYRDHIVKSLTRMGVL
jgi:hypothetical protein